MSNSLEEGWAIACKLETGYWEWGKLTVMFAILNEKDQVEMKALVEQEIKKNPEVFLLTQQANDLKAQTLNLRVQTLKMQFGIAALRLQKFGLQCEVAARQTINFIVGWPFPK